MSTRARDLFHIWGSLKSDRLGVRVMNALRRAGCPSIETALDMKDKTLLQISGIGPQGIKRLRQEENHRPKKIHTKLREVLRSIESVPGKGVDIQVVRITEVYVELYNIKVGEWARASEETATEVITDKDWK